MSLLGPESQQVAAVVVSSNEDEARDAVGVGVGVGVEVGDGDGDDYFHRAQNSFLQAWSHSDIGQSAKLSPPLSSFNIRWSHPTALRHPPLS